MRSLFTSKEVAEVAQEIAQVVDTSGHALCKPTRCIGSQPGPGREQLLWRL